MPTRQRKARKHPQVEAFQEQGYRGLPIERARITGLLSEEWCRRRDSNSHGHKPTTPQGSVSTNFTTSALFSLFLCYQLTAAIRPN